MKSIDRRDFLNTGAKALATAATAGALLRASSAKGKDAASEGPARIESGPVRISLKYNMVRGSAPMLEKFKMLKEIGFDGVELNSPNEFSAEEVLRARDESGLTVDGLVDSVHWRKPMSDPDPEAQQAGVEGLKQAIRDAKAYGATTVLLVPAVVTGKVSYQQAWDRSQENIRKALPYAAEMQIGIALENVWNKFLLSPLEFRDYIDQFDSPWIGAQFDVGNVVEFGYPQEWIRVLGPRIFKLDIKEYGRAKRFSYKLGEGDIDWEAVRAAIAEIDFHGYCAAELPGGDRDYLADVARRMNRVLGRTS